MIKPARVVLSLYIPEDFDCSGDGSMQPMHIRSFRVLWHDDRGLSDETSTEREGDQTASIFLNVYKEVFYTLKNSGWFNIQSVSHAWKEVFPKYTLGTDREYRNAMIKEHGQLFIDTLPSAVLFEDGDASLHLVSSSLSFVLRQASPKLRLSPDVVAAKLALVDVNHRSEIAFAELLSQVCLLGLFKNIGNGEAIDVDKMDPPEEERFHTNRMVGNRLSESVTLLADNMSARASAGRKVLAGFPAEEQAFVQNKQPALFDAIRAYELGSQSGPSSLESAWALLKQGAIRLPGLAVKPRRLRFAKRTVAAYVVYLRTHKNRRYLKSLNRLFPPVSLSDSRHQTVHLADWVWAYIKWTPALYNGSGEEVSSRGGATPSKRLKAVNEVLRWIPIGTSQPLVIGLLAAALTHVDGDAIFEAYLKSGLCFTDAHFTASRCKSLGTVVRKCGVTPQHDSLTPSQVRAMAYYDLLSGRAPHTTDWSSEIHNRCTATLHIQSPRVKFTVVKHLKEGLVEFCPRWLQDSENTDPAHMREDKKFYKDLYDEVYQICSPLVTTKNTREPLDRFMARRSEWMASGSSAGQKLDISIKKGQAQVESVKVGKRAWAENITVKDVEDVLHSKTAIELAHTSEKYENGKARAIYGVEPMHYVINTYATKGFEEKLHLIPGLEKGSTGAGQAHQEHMRAWITESNDMECTMLDYADFNRHHTPKAQAILFDVFASLGKKKGAHPDWILANKWVAKSKFNMQALFPQEDKPRRVIQGMFSGTRSTDLINTVLNLAYFRLAVKYLASLGIEPCELYHVHQGDDVWISNKDELWSRALFYCLNNMGFLFQESKQMFGQGRGEYLRVLYLQGTGGGYFARALSNYITRPLQQDSSLDPIAWARTIREGVALLSRRGMQTDGVQALYKDGIGFWARARAHNRDRAPISIPAEYLNAPALYGGIGCPPPHTRGKYVHDDSAAEMPPYPTFKSRLNLRELRLPTKMTDDWLAHVSKMTSSRMRSKTFDIDLLRDQLVLTNYGPDLAPYIKDRGWAELKRAWARCRQSVGKRHKTWFSSSELRPVKGIKQAVVAACPAYNSDSGLPDYIHKVDWALHLQRISSPITAEAKDKSRLSSVLQNIINKSQFKSETTFAQAFKLNRTQAVSMILQIASDKGYGNTELSAILQPVLLAENDSLLAWVLGEVGDINPGVADWANTTIWQYTNTQFINSTLQWIPTHSNAKAVDVYKHLKLAYESYVVQLLHTPTTFTKVVY